MSAPPHRRLTAATWLLLRGCWRVARTLLVIGAALGPATPPPPEPPSKLETEDDDGEGQEQR